MNEWKYEWMKDEWMNDLGIFDSFQHKVIGLETGGHNWDSEGDREQETG